MSSSSTLSIGGLASGLDTNSIIDQLVALEQQKVTKIQKTQTSARSTLSDVGTLRSKLSSLRDSAKAVGTMESFDLYSATSSDKDTATITGTGVGAQGNYEITVQQLASSLKVASGAFKDATTALGQSGTLRISTSADYQKNNPGKTYVDVKIDAADSLADIASHINSAAGTGASASVLTLGSNDTRLVLTGMDTGSQGFTVSDPEASATSDLAKTLGFTETSSGSWSTQNSLRLAAGGAATLSSKLSDLYAGVGQTLAAGDTISFGEGLASYTIAADSTVKDLLDAASSALGTSETSPAKVTLDASGRISVSGADSAAVSKFNLTLGQLPVGGLSDSQSSSFANVIQDGQNAFYTLNGISVESATNDDSRTILGATVNLLKVSASPVKVSVSRDDATIKKNIQAFVDSYNAIQDYIKTNTAITVSESKDSSSTTGSSSKTIVKGTLTGEYAVTSLKSQLQGVISSSVPALEGKSKYTSLASIGIMTDAKTGQLAIDDKKLDKALASDFDGVRRLFAASGWSDNPGISVGRWSKDTRTGTYYVDADTDSISTHAPVTPPEIADSSWAAETSRADSLLSSASGPSRGLILTAPKGSGTAKVTFVRGIADQIEELYARATDYQNGSLTAATKNVQSRIDDYSKRIDDQQDRVDAYRKRLVTQFTAMEKSMQNIKSQSSSFLSQLGSA